MVAEMSIAEARALLGVLSEFFDGPYAFPEDEWDTLMLSRREDVEAIYSDLLQALSDFDVNRT